MTTCWKKIKSMTRLEMENELEACGFDLEHAWRNIDLWVDG
jgi:hypothetical protein